MAKFSSKHRKTTSLDLAISSAKIMFLVVGIASTLFLISIFIQRFLLSFSSPITWNYPEFSRFSSTYLFIIVHFIIIIIWRLNNNHLHDSAPDSDLYSSSSSSISRKSSIEHLLVSQQSSDSIVELRTTSQELSPPIVDIHTVGSLNGKDFPTPSIGEHEDETIEQCSTPVYADEMNADEQGDYSDSLDATWQAIIQKQLEKGESWEKFNREVKEKLRLTRDAPVVVERTEFRKSDTFKGSKGVDEAFQDSVKKEMRKSKTFRESVSNNSSSIGWRGRNVWVEKDETFRSKVEAFIKMNYDQRLKRQGSNVNRRVEMVSTA